MVIPLLFVVWAVTDSVGIGVFQYLGAPAHRRDLDFDDLVLLQDPQRATTGRDATKTPGRIAASGDGVWSFWKWIGRNLVFAMEAAARDGQKPGLNRPRSHERLSRRICRRRLGSRPACIASVA